MKLLITADQVIQLAFEGRAHGCEELLTDGAILEAQHKYVRPVLGLLYNELIAGDHESLAEEWVRPALAHYVKLGVLADIQTRAGRLGVVQFSGSTFKTASDDAFSALYRSLRRRADALLDAAVSCIEAHPELYPAYRRCDNVRRRVSTYAGVVL